MVNRNSSVLKYDVVFEEAAEGGYTAYVPSLPGCISEGDTFEEAKVNIADAIKLYQEDKHNGKLWKLSDVEELFA